MKLSPERAREIGRKGGAVRCKKGFAKWPLEKRRAVATKASQHARDIGRGGHRWTSEEARAAGRVGGRIGGVVSQLRRSERAREQ